MAKVRERLMVSLWQQQTCCWEPVSSLLSCLKLVCKRVHVPTEASPLFFFFIEIRSPVVAQAGLKFITLQPLTFFKKEF
jgi:hypothetical protein